MGVTAMSDYVLNSNAIEQQRAADRFLLWIDRVGVFFVCLKDEVTIGGPAAEGVSADVSLLANLSRRHASLVRGSEGYLLHAHSGVTVAGRSVQERIDLADGNEFALGGSVRMRFRLPSVMSGTARLEFLSGHRPAKAADGVILMDDTCLLGAGTENHVRCPAWTENVLLFRRDGGLWCKSRGELFIDGKHVAGLGPLPPGSVVSGADFRFWLETV